MSGFLGGGTAIYCGGGFLSAPTGPPKATTPVLSGSVIAGVPTLDWTASTVAGSFIAEYDIYREVDGTPPFVFYDFVDGSVLTYEDLGADPTLHNYTYYVIAVPFVGEDSDQSNEITLGLAPPATITVHVTSANSTEIPYTGTWETAGTGYSSDGGAFGTLMPAGAIDSSDINGHFLAACCVITGGPPAGRGLMIVFPAGTSQDTFDSVDVTLAGGSTHYFASADADFSTRDDNGTVDAGGNWACWLWVTADVDFVAGEVTTVTFNAVTA